MGQIKKRGPIGIVKMKQVSVRQYVPFICARCHEERFASIEQVGHRLMRGQPYKRTLPCKCGGVMKRSRFRVM
jgi:hypothetical protein